MLQPHNGSLCPEGGVVRGSIRSGNTGQPRRVPVNKIKPNRTHFLQHSFSYSLLKLTELFVKNHLSSPMECPAGMKIYYKFPKQSSLKRTINFSPRKGIFPGNPDHMQRIQRAGMKIYSPYLIFFSKGRSWLS